jgi:hypothetical protein
MQEDGESVKSDWMQPPGNGHKITHTELQSNVKSRAESY